MYTCSPTQQCSLFCGKSLGPGRTPGEVGEKDRKGEGRNTGGIRERKRKLMEASNPCAWRISVYYGNEWVIVGDLMVIPGWIWLGVKSTRPHFLPLPSRACL